MNGILYKACENFANTLGLEIEKCKSDDIKGYISKITISGDKNYDIFLKNIIY